ncbi:MAG: B-box zinc finger protein [Candidatus Hydrothermarchaeota archaeon]
MSKEESKPYIVETFSLEESGICDECGHKGVVLFCTPCDRYLCEVCYHNHSVSDEEMHWKWKNNTICWSSNDEPIEKLKEEEKEE